MTIMMALTSVHEHEEGGSDVMATQLSQAQAILYIRCIESTFHSLPASLMAHLRTCIASYV